MLYEIEFDAVHWKQQEGRYQVICTKKDKTISIEYYDSLEPAMSRLKWRSFQLNGSIL